MSLIVRPMLAVKADMDKVQFPVMASPKLDGIRCLVIDGQALTRKFKLIPNTFVRKWIETNVADGSDGELGLRDPTAPFKDVSSAIMRRGGEPDFVFRLFDWVVDDLQEHYLNRIKRLISLDKFRRSHGLVPEWANRIHVVDQMVFFEMDSLMERHAEYLADGYEGTMIRTVDSPYKCPCPAFPKRGSRSTVKEGWLLKIKNFVDEEAVVICVQERMHNTNELETDEVGHAKRSHKKDGMVGTGTMGALRCRFDDGTEFSVGTGFDDELRREIWEDRVWTDDEETDGTEFALLGQRVKIKYQPDDGGRQPGQKPRFPSFLGVRHPDD